MLPKHTNPKLSCGFNAVAFSCGASAASLN